MARTQQFSNGASGSSIREMLNAVLQYSATYSYNINDMCFYNGDLYRSLIDTNVGTTPAEGTRWTKILNKDDIALLADANPLTRANARLLAKVAKLVSDPTCFLYHHFATSGANVDYWEMQVPMGNNRFACYGFKDFGNGVMNFGVIREGIPVSILHHSDGSVTKTGTWANSTQAGLFLNDTASQSSTAGDTIAATVTGHTLFLRNGILSNGGYGLVAIDGDYYAASRLPQVTQALIDAGKFDSGDLGKRYINCYNTTAFYDNHICLAEGLKDTTHTITVQAKGTAAGGTGNRVYVIAFMAATSTVTAPNATNCGMGYVRYISDYRTGSQYSAMTCVMALDPNGDNSQFVGENHALDANQSSETESSHLFKVDGVSAASLSRGEYSSGLQITLDRTSTAQHVDSVSADYTKVVQYLAEAPFGLKADVSMTQETTRNATAYYTGMLSMGARDVNSGSMDNTAFDLISIGEKTLATTADDQTTKGVLQKDTMVFHSTQHDTAVLVHLPNLVDAVENWRNSYARNAFFVDRTDKTDKAYFARIGTLPVSITSGTVFNFQILWRVLRTAEIFDQITSESVELDTSFPETALDTKAPSTKLTKDTFANHLSKTNTTAYTPTADYHPATKKYVDDNAGGGGAAGFDIDGGASDTDYDNLPTFDGGDSTN